MSRMKFFEKLDEILNWNAKTPEIQKKNATKNATRKFEISFMEMFVNYNELKSLYQINQWREHFSFYHL